MAILGEPVTSASAEFGEPTCGDLPGDTATTGRLVVDGAGVEGQHHTATDVDWYAVSLEAGVDYQFDADPTDPQPRLYLLKIHDDQGTELRTSAIAPAGGPPNWYQHPNRVNSLPFSNGSGRRLLRVHIGPEGRRGARSGVHAVGAVRRLTPRTRPRRPSPSWGSQPGSI